MIRKFYWTSPLIGIVCQYLVVIMYIVYDALFVEHSESGSVLSDFGLVNFVYWVVLLPILGYSYVYLYVVKRFTRQYRFITWSSVLFILTCSIFLWNKVFGKDLACVGKIVSLGKYLVWVACYFLPIYRAAHLYVCKSRQNMADTCRE